MIRIAAVGDLHYSVHSGGLLRNSFLGLRGQADLLLLAGDLTQHGKREEARVLLEDLLELPVPVVCVLGNHDFHSNEQQWMVDDFEARGIRVLEGQSAELKLKDCTVGVAGIKGFGGGFAGACASAFGEPEMKAFAVHSKLQAERLKKALHSLTTDYRIALLHFSPTHETLFGERKEIYPFLGSYLLGEAIDTERCDLAFHGHAHHGVERGTTPGGVPVRNVAQLVIRHCYQIYQIEPKAP